MTNVDKSGPTEPEAPKPALAVVPAPPPPTFEAEIEGRRRAIVARLGSLKADARIEAVQERDQLKARLSELSHLIKENVVDGWDNLAVAGKTKLANWLAK